MPHPAFTSGKVAVVTGAALGIGRAAAVRFAEMGLKVCLVDLPSADLKAAEADESGRYGLNCRRGDGRFRSECD